MNDLVKRLRDAAHVDPHYGKSVYMSLFDYDFVLELARTLEAQAARNTELEAKNTMLADANKELIHAFRERDALRDKLERAKEALRRAGNQLGDGNRVIATTTIYEALAELSADAPALMKSLPMKAISQQAFALLMSALRNTETKDG